MSVFKLHFDYETFSEINLKTCGMYRYAEDPSTEVICLSYALDDEEPELWTPYDNEPKRLFRAMKQCKHFVGHNVNFEIQIWLNVCRELYGWPMIDTDKAICTAAMAAMHSLPRSLEGVCEALNVEHLKDKNGTRLIHKLCKPRKPSKKNPATRWTPETAPDDFEDFYEYCKQDVRAERDVDKKLDMLPKREQELWQLDRVINERGVYVDQEALEGAMFITEVNNERLEKEASRIAAGAFKKTSQREAVMEWTRVKGYPLMEYTDDYLKGILKDPDCPKNIKRVIEIRRATSRTSTKKFNKMALVVCEDGTIKGTLMYHGAGTGRWAGRIIQPQNLPRPIIKEDDITIAIELMKERNIELLSLLFNGDPSGTMVSCIRGVLIPKSGNVFYCGDFANIEGRILLWCADDKKGMQLFIDGLDLYIDMAVDIYNIEYDEIYHEYKNGDDSKRRMGKLAILGLGYAMGWKKFIDKCAEKGVIIDKKFAEKVVDAYRTKFQKVVNWWNELDKAAKLATMNEGKRYEISKVSFIRDGIFLKMTLPSGRNLYYPYPKIVEMKTPWGGYKPTLTYMVENKKKWMRTKTFGGKLAENAVQAISRDLLREAMFRTEDAGYETTLTVHDEILSEVEKDEGSVKEFEELMSILPKWAKGAPVEAECWTGMRYKK